PEDVHGEERRPRADESEPEAELSDALVIHPTRDLGKPVVHASQDWKDGRAENHKVKVRDDVVARVHLLVEGDRGDRDPGKTPDDKEDDEPDDPQQRRLEVRGAAEDGDDPGEQLK